MDVITFIYILVGARILIGLAPIVAASFSSRMMGFPIEHDTATTRLFARLFGIRDIGLGVLVLFAMPDPRLLGFTLLFNAATDAADACAISVPLLRRQGLNRPAGLSLLLASSACLAWLTLWWLTHP